MEEQPREMQGTFQTAILQNNRQRLLLHFTSFLLRTSSVNLEKDTVKQLVIYQSQTNPTSLRLMRIGKQTVLSLKFRRNQCLCNIFKRILPDKYLLIFYMKSRLNFAQLMFAFKQIFIYCERKSVHKMDKSGFFITFVKIKTGLLSCVR